jgi:hypothetical protein
MARVPPLDPETLTPEQQRGRGKIEAVEEYPAARR